MEEEKLKLFKAYIKVKDITDKYVILEEDEQGRYIRYAFKDGCPDDNRCLSWYSKLQPEALKRNGHDIETWKKHLHKTGKLYFLSSFTCSNFDAEGDERCRPGHPSKNCLKKGSCSKHWTYDEPVKCGCWLLEEVNIDSMSYKFTYEELKKMVELLKKDEHD